MIQYPEKFVKRGRESAGFFCGDAVKSAGSGTIKTDCAGGGPLLFFGGCDTIKPNGIATGDLYCMGKVW